MSLTKTEFKFKLKEALQRVPEYDLDELEILLNENINHISQDVFDEETGTSLIQFYFLNLKHPIHFLKIFKFTKMEDFTFFDKEGKSLFCYIRDCSLNYDQKILTERRLESELLVDCILRSLIDATSASAEIKDIQFSIEENYENLLTLKEIEIGYDKCFKPEHLEFIKRILSKAQLNLPESLLTRQGILKSSEEVLDIPSEVYEQLMVEAIKYSKPILLKFILQLGEIDVNKFRYTENLSNFFKEQYSYQISLLGASADQIDNEVKEIDRKIKVKKKNVIDEIPSSAIGLAIYSNSFYLREILFRAGYQPSKEDYISFFIRNPFAELGLKKAIDFSQIKELLTCGVLFSNNLSRQKQEERISAIIGSTLIEANKDESRKYLTGYSKLYSFLSFRGNEDYVKSIERFGKFISLFLDDLVRLDCLQNQKIVEAKSMKKIPLSRFDESYESASINFIGILQLIQKFDFFQFIKSNQDKGDPCQDLFEKITSLASYLPLNSPLREYYGVKIQEISVAQSDLDDVLEQRISRSKKRRERKKEKEKRENELSKDGSSMDYDSEVKKVQYEDLTTEKVFIDKIQELEMKNRDVATSTEQPLRIDVATSTEQQPKIDIATHIDKELIATQTRTIATSTPKTKSSNSSTQTDSYRVAEPLPKRVILKKLRQSMTISPEFLMQPKLEENYFDMILQDDHQSFIDLFTKNPAIAYIPDQSGRLPIFFAIAYGRLEIVDFLTKDSVDSVFTTDQNNLSALHYLSICDNIKVFNLLKERIPSEFKKETTTVKGETILHFMADYGSSSSELIEYFFEDLTSEEKNELINKRDFFSFTALDLAISNNDTEVIKSLVVNGADINLINFDKDSRWRFKQFFFEVKNEELLDYGQKSKLERLCGLYDKQGGFSALQILVLKGNYDAIYALQDYIDFDSIKDQFYDWCSNSEFNGGIIKQFFETNLARPHSVSNPQSLQSLSAGEINQSL